MPRPRMTLEEKKAARAMRVMARRDARKAMTLQRRLAKAASARALKASELIDRAASVARSARKVKSYCAKARVYKLACNLDKRRQRVVAGPRPRRPVFGPEPPPKVVNF